MSCLASRCATIPASEDRPIAGLVGPQSGSVLGPLRAGGGYTPGDDLPRSIGDHVSGNLGGKGGGAGVTAGPWWGGGGGGGQVSPPGHGPPPDCGVGPVLYWRDCRPANTRQRQLPLGRRSPDLRVTPAGCDYLGPRLSSRVNRR